MFQERTTLKIESFPQKQPSQEFNKKIYLKNFTKFTGKHVPEKFIKKETPTICSDTCVFCEICEYLRWLRLYPYLFYGLFRSLPLP